MNHDRLLRKLGSNAELARVLNLNPSTVSVWRMRGIPPKAWGAIVRLATERGIEGVTMDILERTSPRYGIHGAARLDRKRVPARKMQAVAADAAE